MTTVQIFRLFLIMAFAFMGFQGCEESPTGPQVGSGTLLKATIDGQAYTFIINAGVTEYDPSITVSTFAGSTDVDPVQSIRVTFDHDIDNGTFPITKTGGDITITVVTNDDTGTLQKSYVCSVLGSNCRVGLVVSNGEIVDGTFSGTLINSQNSNDTLTVTDGEFSVKLPRL